ncbi:MAG: activase, partial [Actinomycetia bacterium]|nr:activase [Actinomycetes bacterium]
MKTLGIDFGSSNIKLCYMEDGAEKWHKLRNHDGNVKGTTLDLLNESDIPDDTVVSVTGMQGRKNFNMASYIEAVAIEKAIGKLKLDVNAVVSMGGESLVLYTISNGMIETTIQGDKCASGTGEFFKQQLLRMDLTLDDIESEGKGATVHKLSSRCSVFMKSDCTHKLNKNEATKGDIIISLSNVMVSKITEFLLRAKVNSGKVLLIGGVTKNPFVVDIIRSKLKEIEFIIPEEAPYFEAFGAAVMAETRGEKLPAVDKLFKEDIFSFGFMPDLKHADGKVDYLESKRGRINPDSEYILGIDGGSTTTKITLV